jgi:hypothetical protein
MSCRYALSCHGVTPYAAFAIIAAALITPLFFHDAALPLFFVMLRHFELFFFFFFLILID